MCVYKSNVLLIFTLRKKKEGLFVLLVTCVPLQIFITLYSRLNWYWGNILEGRYTRVKSTTTWNVASNTGADAIDIILGGTRERISDLTKYFGPIFCQWFAWKVLYRARAGMDHFLSPLQTRKLSRFSRFSSPLNEIISGGCESFYKSWDHFGVISVCTEKKSILRKST